MSWLERLNDRNTRRLARNLSTQGRAVRDLAQTHLSQFADEAGDIAGSAARQVVDYSRNQGAEFARDTLGRYARRAGKLAADAADYGTHEGADLARETLGHYARHARRVAADVADYGRTDGADLARNTVGRYAHRAGELASEAADYGRQEGAILAQAAAMQALRAGRAVKADPVPVIVGAVGVALIANLLFGRRRAE